MGVESGVAVGPRDTSPVCRERVDVCVAASSSLWWHVGSMWGGMWTHEADRLGARSVGRVPLVRAALGCPVSAGLYWPGCSGPCVAPPVSIRSVRCAPRESACVRIHESDESSDPSGVSTDSRGLEGNTKPLRHLLIVL